jgi:hypothetical protein
VVQGHAGGTRVFMYVTEASRSIPGTQVRYLSVTEGSRVMQRSLLWYIGYIEGLFAMRGVTVVYMEIMEGSGSNYIRFVFDRIVHLTYT